jgi:hypothetical protein
MSLKDLNSDQLLESAERAVQLERESTAEVLRHFREIEDRQLYLARGFSSLFDMAVKHFGYCAGSAQLRIASMRLVRQTPEIEVKIETGELSLSAAASVQTFLRNERKEKRDYTREAKLELIDACLGKSSREVQKELAKRNPDVTYRESERYLSEDRIELCFSISTMVKENVDRLKELLSHSNVSMSNEELFGRLVEIGLEKLDPVRKAQRMEKRNSKPLHAHEVKTPVPNPRFIEAAIKRDVLVAEADRGCSYIDTQTKRRCGSRYLLQVDHRRPVSHGGRGERSNLRLLCAQHNRWEYKRYLREPSLEYKAG